MKCSQLPAASEWDHASGWQLEEYRSHVKICRSCRARIFSEAPDQLLFELREAELPEDFWIGFWSSLKRRLAPSSDGARTSDHVFRVLRWVAALIVVGLFLVHGRPIEEAPSTKSLESNEYPLIEDIQSPTATYYIFQPEKDATIVLVFDPEMDL